MRRSLAVACLLIAFALALALPFGTGATALLAPTAAGDVTPGGKMVSEPESPAAQSTPEPEMVTLEGSESSFWPFLNDRPAHENRSPINVIVRGDPNRTVELLLETGEIEWEETEEDHFEPTNLSDAEFLQNASESQNGSVADDGAEPNTTGPTAVDQAEAEREANETGGIFPTDIPWARADGATRLAYLDPGNGEEPYWTTETVQLEDGEYYGHRYHIRIYVSPNPDDEWAVMQTHSEHFDWFTLRHRVDGVEAAQLRLEEDLMAIPGVDIREDVSRVPLGNSGPSDADGWATLADLTALAILPLLGIAARRQGVLQRAEEEVDEHLTDSDRARLRAAADRLEGEHLLLAGTIISIVLGVRLLGITLDRHAAILTVHTIAAVGYAFVAIGLPLATYLIASRLERRWDAAVAASLSLTAAFWLDYGLVGVETLAIDVVLQRLLVVVALGLLAGGATKRARRETRANDLFLVGVAAWTLVLVATLYGLL